jgi:hypothetical protein
MTGIHRRLAALGVAFLCAAPLAASGQTYTKLRNAPPKPVGLGFLLTDGTAMFQANNGKDWYRLTPGNEGSYRNGVWSQLASLTGGYAPNAFASAVLADGRLVIIGGEFNGGDAYVFTNRGAVYDPTQNLWTSLKPPASWTYIGDSPSAVLPNGKFLVGRKFDTRMAALDPATLTWTAVADTGKSDFNSEEGWTLLRDGSILTVDVKNNPNSERFTSATVKWASAGSTGFDLQEPPTGQSIKYGHGLIYHPPGEVGPAILRPDGTVFATGGLHKGAKAGHTAIFHPSTGIWTDGPDFPAGESAGDAYAALLPNGKVLVESETGGLYEFDGVKLTAEPYTARNMSMLLLPTGEVIVDGDSLYKSSGSPSPDWVPTINSFPATVARGGSYKISGTQFNGLSQANAFGDEYQTATNYPLVRITNKATGHVIYARTHDHSSIGVATGSRIVSTHFDVPDTAETGSATLVIVANGISSAPVNIPVN